MGILDAINVSASGLTAQRTRINVISGNLANVSTTRTPEGGPYKRKDVVFESRPAGETFGQVLNEQVQKVGISEIVEDATPPRMQYDPSHPDANAQGYVAMPNINLVEEMVNLLAATRSYEANVTALNSSKDMAMRALEIGK